VSFEKVVTPRMLTLRSLIRKTGRNGGPDVDGRRAKVTGELLSHADPAQLSVERSCSSLRSLRCVFTAPSGMSPGSSAGLCRELRDTHVRLRHGQGERTAQRSTHTAAPRPFQNHYIFSFRLLGPCYLEPCAVVGLTVLSLCRGAFDRCSQPFCTAEPR